MRSLVILLNEKTATSERWGWLSVRSVSRTLRRERSPPTPLHYLSRDGSLGPTQREPEVQRGSTAPLLPKSR